MDKTVQLIEIYKKILDTKVEYVMVVVVRLISDLLHVLYFLYHYILKKVETFSWYFKQLPAKIDNHNDFKNNKL